MVIQAEQTEHVNQNNGCENANTISLSEVTTRIASSQLVASENTDYLAFPIDII